MTQEPISIKLIEYNSSEYRQACQLRYDLFFAEHNLPWEVVEDQNQAKYFHGVIMIKGCVVAYGQLVPNLNKIWQICQMVVKPAYQGQNLGVQLLSTLIKIARQEKAIALT